MCINSFIVFSFYPFSIYGIYDFRGLRGLKNNTPCLPPLLTSLSLSLYLRLPHAGFLWLLPSLTSLQTPPFGLSLLAKSSSDQVDIKHFIHLCTSST